MSGLMPVLAVAGFFWLVIRGVPRWVDFMEKEEARAKGRPVTKWIEYDDEDSDE